MKKIYIPTEEELYKMQEMSNGSSLYQYLLAKVIEVLVLESKLEESEKGILERTYKIFRENPEIAHGICRMYPEEINSSIVAKNDIQLCKYLIRSKSDNSIYGLDNLAYFENGVQTANSVIETTLDILINKLPKTPKYRFEYKEPNTLLDKIFGCELNGYIPNSIAIKLAAVEPAHAVKLNQLKQQFENTPGHTIDLPISNYVSVYGMGNQFYPEYYRHDIICHPDDQVKRLIRCLNTHKRKYQK